MSSLAKQRDESIIDVKNVPEKNNKTLKKVKNVAKKNV